MSNPIFLKRVILSNYKSIKSCSVELGPLLFLVGQNGAGKSNFLDAVRFVSDALNTTLDQALRERGGINEVRRRSSGHPTHFGIRLEWRLTDSSEGVYAFKVGSQKQGGFEVQREECFISGGANGVFEKHHYKTENGKVISKSFDVAPPCSNDRLYLVAASGLPEFRPLFDSLSRMGFYNISPDVIRELQPPDSGEVLKRDGSNLASVLSVLEKSQDDSYSQIVEFLSKVTPGIVGLKIEHAGKKEMIIFKQNVGSNSSPWNFSAENMSDGTLRALGVLTALFQSGGSHSVPFAGIEEPETALHPGAAGVLRDALKAAALRMQVAVTSHSPDLLDDRSISDKSIVAVSSCNGETRIGPVSDADRSAIKDGLYTPGELLRTGQLNLDETELDKDILESDLFGEPGK